MSSPIVIATVMRSDGETGVQTHFNIFRQYLASQSISHQLVTPFSSKAPSLYAVFGLRRLIDRVSGTASVWWYRYWHYVYLRDSLRRVLADLDSCVVYAQCPLSAKAAMEARRDSSQRVVMVVHYNVSQAEEWLEKRKIKDNGVLFNSIKRLEDDILVKLDGIVFVSKFMQQCLQRNLPEVRNIRSKIIPNFVPDRLVATDAKPITGDMVSVGTLEPRKNQEFLLKVLAEMKMRGHQHSLTLVGDGPDREMLVSLTRRLGLQDSVHFVGFVPEAWRLMGQHKIYVHAALIENLPITLIEAMSSGLPVFAPPVGGVPEVYDDGVEGRYWSLDDPAGAADMLIAVLGDADTLANMSGSARKAFLIKFERDIVAAKLHSFLAELSR